MTKIIGLCFLIYGEINHENLWNEWLKNVDKAKYKIYVHYKFDKPLKYFEKYKLKKTIETKYADVSLTHAHNLMFKQAYKDGCYKMINLSQACIPIKTFDYVYNFLTKDNFAHFNITINQTGVFPNCDSVLDYYKRENIQKSSEWFILNRNIAQIVLKMNNEQSKSCEIANK